MVIHHTPLRYKHNWEIEANNAQLAAAECRRLANVAAQFEQELQDAQKESAIQAQGARAANAGVASSRADLRKLADELSRKNEEVIALESANQDLVS